MMYKLLLFTACLLKSYCLFAQANENALLSKKINGMLRHLTSNPNYFTDNSGEAILLTGSHTWENFLDIFSEENLPKLDWKEWLDMMESKNHNFMRFIQGLA